MNLKELKELFRLIERTDFYEVEVSREGWSLKVKRGAQALSAVQTFVSPTVNTSLPHGLTEFGEVKKTEAKTEEKPGVVVTSPFVGTFYRSPSPESEAYADVGKDVKKGQVLCIVEAMKLMNEIESEVNGQVVEVYAENGQPVEFGDKLFRILPK